MNISITFLLNTNGLFDFDFTFLTEAFLFLLFSFIVSNLFLSPISKQIELRNDFIDYTINKSIILLDFGYEILLNSIEILKDEINEISRQNKIIKCEANNKFESEIIFIEKDNLNLLMKVKKNLTIKSVFLISNFKTNFNTLIIQFFNKKFQSN
jgi:hypothetical protein